MLQRYLCLFSIIMLSACGSVGNAVLSNQHLQHKAAKALRVSSHQVTISERNAGLDDITFIATVRGKKHYCYVTTTGVRASDAVCSDMKPQIKVNK